MNHSRATAAIVIPAHNEEACLARCLEAACHTADLARRAGHIAFVVIVLDRCSDGSAMIAARYPVQLMHIDAASVGAARDAGARRAIEMGATWLAFTDADTIVAADWLQTQLSLCTSVVCGTVAVSDWHLHDPLVKRAYDAAYSDFDGHRHIHGANLGISTAAYTACGGFDSVALNEDVSLVQRLSASGFSIAWSAAPRVATSARLANRVPGGFGGFVAGLCRAFRADNADDTLAA